MGWGITNVPISFDFPKNRTTQEAGPKCLALPMAVPDGCFILTSPHPGGLVSQAVGNQFFDLLSTYCGLYRK